MQYFDYETYQKGYERFNPTKENVKKNEGRYVIFLLNRDYDPVRGYMSIRGGRLTERRYSALYLDDFGNQIDTRDILEMAIRIEE